MAFVLYKPSALYLREEPQVFTEAALLGWALQVLEYGTGPSSFSHLSEFRDNGRKQPSSTHRLSRPSSSPWACH